MCIKNFHENMIVAHNDKVYELCLRCARNRESMDLLTFKIKNNVKYSKFLKIKK